jgi:hypothetical protein
MTAGTTWRRLRDAVPALADGAGERRYRRGVAKQTRCCSNLCEMSVDQSQERVTGAYTKMGDQTHNVRQNFGNVGPVAEFEIRSFAGGANKKHSIRLGRIDVPRRVDRAAPCIHSILALRASRPHSSPHAWTAHSIAWQIAAAAVNRPRMSSSLRRGHKARPRRGLIHARRRRQGETAERVILERYLADSRAYHLPFFDACVRVSCARLPLLTRAPQARYGRLRRRGSRLRLRPWCVV